MKKKTTRSRSKVNLFQSNSQRKGVGRKSLFFGSKLVMLATMVVIVGVVLGAFAILQKSRGSNAAVGDVVPVNCSKTVSGGASVASSISGMANGQTLCLSGTFNMGAVKVSNSGITIASTPGQQATLNGQFNISGSNNKFLNLKIDGRGVNSGTILLYSGANNNLFKANDVTSTAPNKSSTDQNDRQGICFNIGESGAVAASGPQNTTIEQNRIFNCGWGKYDQALYLAGARYTRVVNNFIYDNPMFGLQFFPDSDNATVENNVFYNNAAGVTFSSGFGKQSENNILRNNIIGNSGGNYYGMGYKDSTSWGAADVNHWWGSGTGAGNQATGNCLFGRGIESNPDGYTVSNNTKVSDPMFINAGGKDFGLKAGSPCTGKGIQTSSSTNPTSTSPTPTPTSPTTTSPTPTTPTPTSPTPQSPTGSLNFKNFTPWTAYEGYDLKNDGKTITRNNTDTLLVKYNKGTWANGHYGGYCITRAAGSPQPKSITFTAEYNSWGGNSVYFYPGSSNNKKWVVGNTYGVTKKSTQTVTLGTETKYCFGNVVNFPSGAAFSSFDNDRFLKVTGYTFNY